ncbi:MAG: hypothetical protein JWN04_6163 [Myxococcaceae bacterium]|nr:hypothetical protein [Myxococcaceae bacterium]
MENLKNPLRSLTVYTVIPQPDGKDAYLRVGSGQGDGHGATLLLDAIPLHGKLVVRACEPADRSLARRRLAGAAV